MPTQSVDAREGRGKSPQRCDMLLDFFWSVGDGAEELVEEFATPACETDDGYCVGRDGQRISHSQFDLSIIIKNIFQGSSCIGIWTEGLENQAPQLCVSGGGCATLALPAQNSTHSSWPSLLRCHGENRDEKTDLRRDYRTAFSSRSNHDFRLGRPVAAAMAASGVCGK
jgi:hypothetical protein